MLDRKPLKRAIFHQLFPITVNPATRHQAYLCKHIVPMEQGVKFGKRQGAAITLESANITVTVSSDLFSRTQIRNLRPAPAPVETHTSLSTSNQLLMTTNIDADFTGFNATAEGITVPVEGQLITQTNTTILNRCTLTQADIASGFSVGYPDQHFLKSTTVPVDAAAYTYPSQINKLECPYRTMLFTSQEPPNTTASSPTEWISIADTSTVYDPSFGTYLAYPFASPFKDDINSELIQTWEKFHKIGDSLTNIHRYNVRFNDAQIYYGSNGLSVDPIRGGLYFLLISDVNVGMSETTNPETFQLPERLNSRWLVSVNTEVFYYD